MKRRTVPMQRSGTSPYQKKAKRPYQYPGWVKTGIIPREIEVTLLGRRAYKDRDAS